MKFRVTQCPACESTFNASPRLFETGSGRVRCGACLMVFEAAENLIAGEEVDNDPLDSVFVGAAPHDYFDPSTLLTGTDLHWTKASVDNDNLEQKFNASDLWDEDTLEAVPEETPAVQSQVSIPLEPTAGRRRLWRRQLLWSSLTVVAAIVLAGQYLGRHMDTYSQVTSLRPLYQWSCGWLGCTVPEYSDIAAIRGESLVVRSHPQVEEALQVHISFHNTAPFPQAFPVLVLSFNTATNSTIALREFAPPEYLDPGPHTVELIPVMAPVEIELELIDPGPEAVNYSLAFRRP